MCNIPSIRLIITMVSHFSRGLVTGPSKVIAKSASRTLQLFARGIGSRFIGRVKFSEMGVFIIVYHRWLSKRHVVDDTCGEGRGEVLTSCSPETIPSSKISKMPNPTVTNSGKGMDL